MRRILSERNLVVILFISVLVIFFFAQQDAKRIEKQFMNAGAAVLPSSPSQSAINETIQKPGLPGTQSAE
jgi:hypothetical protein